MDLDFRSVYRELAGVDSMIQAAGRCNREGTRTAKESKVFILNLRKDRIYWGNDNKLMWQKFDCRWQRSF